MNEGHMRLSELITVLKSAKGTDRGLDKEIGLVVGLDNKIVLSANDGNERRTVIWLSPDRTVIKLPNYTGSLDDAVALVRMFAPSHNVLFAWEDGMGSAKVGNLPPVLAASPTIALCISALQIKMRLDLSAADKSL